MTNICSQSLQKIYDGARFSISLPKRNLRINGKYIIKNGEYEGDLGIRPVENPLRVAEYLYYRYRHSVPSERSESKRRKYFRALPEDELTDEDMLYGEPREIARFRLEFFILALILNRSLNWDDFAKGQWFWQSPQYDEFIILKNWITNNQNIQK